MIKQKLDLSQLSNYEIFKEIFPYEWLMGLVEELDLSRSEHIDLLQVSLPALDKMSPSEAESARQFILMKLPQN